MQLDNDGEDGEDDDQDDDGGGEEDDHDMFSHQVDLLVLNVKFSFPVDIPVARISAVVNPVDG